MARLNLEMGLDKDECDVTDEWGIFPFGIFLMASSRGAYKVDVSLKVPAVYRSEARRSQSKSPGFNLLTVLDQACRST